MANLNPGMVAQQQLQSAATQQLIDAGYYPGYSNSLGGNTDDINNNPAIKAIMDKYYADEQTLGEQIKAGAGNRTSPYYGGSYTLGAGYELSNREVNHNHGLSGQIGATLSNPIFQLATAAISAGQGGLLSGLGDAIGGTAAAGDSSFPSILGSALESVGGATGIGNSVGSLFGDASLGSDIAGGVNSLKSGISDFFSPVTNAISDAGNSISNLFSPSDSGGSSSLSDIFGSGAGGAPTSDPSVTGARDLASAGASGSTPSGLFSSGPSVGAPASGGGAAGGFVSDVDPLMTGISTGENAANTADSTGSALPWLQGTSGAAPNAAGTLPWNGMTPEGSNLIGNATSAAAGAMNPSAGTLTGGNVQPSTLASIFGGGGSAIGGIAKAGLGGLLNNPNNKGFDAQINAGNQIQQDYQPFYQSGVSANNTLSDLFGTNGSDAAAQAAARANFQNTPGYQFALNQGVAAQDASAAAKGNLLSGNQQKALTDYGQGLANQTYNQYVQNLQGQAAQGQAAAGGVATGQAGVANAQAGKSGAAANNQNSSLAGILAALFPQKGISSLASLF